jgi:arsenate reductase-like glutaredoxin family protein
MTFDEVIRDRDFAALPMEERRKVLSHVDTDFACLDVNEQNKVLYRLAPTTASQGNPNPRNESISAERPYDPEWAKDYPNLYGLYGAAKELYKTIGRPAISGIGLGVGAAGGAASPVPGGAMIGGGLGYAAGENINAALDELFELRRPGTPLARRAVETLKNIETGAVLEGGGNILSRGAGWTLGKLLAPYSKEYTPQSANIASKAKELGITLSPAEVTGSKNLALVESLLEKSPTSADVPLGWRQTNQLDPLKVLREKALEGSQSATELAVGSDIKAKVDAYLSRFKGVKQEYLDAMRKRLYASALGSNKTASELGESAKELLSNRSAAAVAKRRAVYDEVGANVPDEKVRASELQKVADELAKEVSELPSQNQTLKSVLAWARETKVDPKVEQIVRQMEADNYTPELQKKILEQMGFDAGKLTREPVQRNWKTLQDFRTQLNDLIRQEDMSIKSGNPSLRGQVTNEGRIYTRLKEALDKDFEKIAESSGSEALDALKAANAFIKTSMHQSGNKR